MINELFGFILSGNIFGIPTIIMMALPFFVGLFIGFLIKKVFKIVILVALIAFILSYLGFFTISLPSLTDIVDVYGPQVIFYATILLGILPIGLGLFVGLILGFLIG